MRGFTGLLFLLLLLSRSLAWAQPPQSPEQIRRNNCTNQTAADNGTPIRACVGLYVVRLSEIDLKTQSFFADFYLWMRWRGDEALAGLEVVNGDMLELSEEYKASFDGFNYTYVHVEGRMRAQFDLKRYPLDEHMLSIQIESAESPNDELQLVPDDEIAVSSQVSAPGWDFLPATATVAPFTYPTDFGDMREAKHASYSRLQLQIPLRRQKSQAYLKTFLVLFISVAIGLVVFVLKADNLDSRLGIGVASIFGVVSSHLVVEQNLPETAQFTMADHIHIAAMVVVFLSVLWSAVIHRMGKEPDAAERLDKIVGALLTVGFVTTVGWLS